MVVGRGDIDGEGMLLLGVMVVRVVDGVWNIDGVGVGYVPNVPRGVVLHILMVYTSDLVHCSKLYGSDRGHPKLSYGTYILLHLSSKSSFF